MKWGNMPDGAVVRLNIDLYSFEDMGSRAQYGLLSFKDIQENMKRTHVAWDTFTYDSKYSCLEGKSGRTIPVGNNEMVDTDTFTVVRSGSHKPSFTSHP